MCVCVCVWQTDRERERERECMHESNRGMELPQRKIKCYIPCEDTMLRVQATRIGASALLLDDMSSCSNFCSKATFSNSATVLCWNSFKCSITFHPTATINLSPSSTHLQNQYWCYTHTYTHIVYTNICRLVTNYPQCTFLILCNSKQQQKICKKIIFQNKFPAFRYT